MGVHNDIEAMRASNKDRIDALVARGHQPPGLQGLYVAVLLETLLGDALPAAQLDYELRAADSLTRAEARADQIEAELRHLAETGGEPARRPGLYLPG